MVDVRRTAPPRFVPTLTDVVRPADTPASALARAHEQATPEAAPAAPPAPAAVPEPALQAVAPHAAQPPVQSPARAVPDGFEEYVVHRVMQRVDLVLEQRLREAIATVVLEQTRSLVPRLHEEVESVIRYSVYDAVAEELTGERKEQ